MAFHQTTRQAARQVYRPALQDDLVHDTPQLASRSIEESQTWVLFSPATDASTTTSYLTTTHKTHPTPGRSRLSEFGSLDTLAPSDLSVDHHPPPILVHAAEEAVEDDDDHELDSLDSHLPEFRSTPNVFSSSSQALLHATPVVPTHDGLGSFRLDQEGMGIEVQNRLYAFEKYNPRRSKRRRDSLDVAETSPENEEGREVDKMRRVENWRLEQSRFLLERIQKETRRRRQSSLSSSSVRQVNTKVGDVGALDGGDNVVGDDDDQGGDWHDDNETDSELDRETLWGRITRRFINDFMGIDDKLLAVLFGEELPDEEDLSSTPKPSVLPLTENLDKDAPEKDTSPAWQLRILECVAKELGHLVNRLSEHPGAFSTYSRIQQIAIPYAGLPPIPETTNHPPWSRPDVGEGLSPLVMPESKPTVATQARLIDVLQARNTPSSVHMKPPSQVDKIGPIVFTQDEWEKELDVKLIFRYLRSRFLSRSSSDPRFGSTSHVTTTSIQDAAAKAARVRQHHPLVSRSRTMERRLSKAPAIPPSPMLFRHASSCASQSTRRSVRKSSCSSSRHYWDIGGSVGTGSLIATTGPMGSWGEV